MILRVGLLNCGDIVRVELVGPVNLNGGYWDRLRPESGRCVVLKVVLRHRRLRLRGILQLIHLKVGEARFRIILSLRGNLGNIRQLRVMDLGVLILIYIG